MKIKIRDRIVTRVTAAYAAAAVKGDYAEQYDRSHGILWRIITLPGGGRFVGRSPKEVVTKVIDYIELMYNGGLAPQLVIDLTPLESAKDRFGYPRFEIEN